MTDLKITEATVQLVVNEQEPVFLQVLRGPIVVAGGGGVTVHNDLTGRSDADAHPISSITGLAAALAAAGNVDSVNGQTGTVSLDLDDLTDVDTTTDPPDADDVLAWDGVMWTPATLTALGAPGLSNATPADLGTAAPGVATEASRADHVHDLPSAADVGAAASLHVHSGADITSGTVAAARLGTGTADATTFLRGDGTWGRQVLPSTSVSGAFYGPGGQVGNETSRLSGVNQWWGCFVYLPSGSYDQLVIPLAATGASTVAFGIYPCSRTGLPAAGTAPVVNAGTADMSVSSGLILLTISLAVATPGVFAIAGSVVTRTSQPTYRMVGTYAPSGINDSMSGFPTTAMAVSIHGGVMTGFSGLPAVPVAAGVGAWPDDLYLNYSIPKWHLRSA